MYLKPRDKKILQWIEDVSTIKEKDGINNKIAGNLFYNDCKDPYYNASRRLKELFKEGFLKRHRKNPHEEYVYYRSQRPLSEHQLKLLEVYAVLNTFGKVTLLEKEVMIKCKNKNRKNDGLIVVEVNGYEYPIIVEIDKSHDTDSVKINDIVSSNYYQGRFGIMPLFLIVKKYEFQKKYYPKEANVVYANWTLEQINMGLFSDE